MDVPQVRGTYVPVVGDFDGDGHDDIAWTREGDATIWHARPDDPHLPADRRLHRLPADPARRRPPHRERGLAGRPHERRQRASAAWAGLALGAATLLAATAAAPAADAGAEPPSDALVFVSASRSGLRRRRRGHHRAPVARPSSAGRPRRWRATSRAPPARGSCCTPPARRPTASSTSTPTENGRHGPTFVPMTVNGTYTPVGRRLRRQRHRRHLLVRPRRPAPTRSGCSRPTARHTSVRSRHRRPTAPSSSTPTATARRHPLVRPGPGGRQPVAASAPAPAPPKRSVRINGRYQLDRRPASATRPERRRQEQVFCSRRRPGRDSIWTFDARRRPHLALAARHDGRRLPDRRRLPRHRSRLHLLVPARAPVTEAVTELRRRGRAQLQAPAPAGQRHLRAGRGRLRRRRPRGHRLDVGPGCATVWQLRHPATRPPLQPWIAPRPPPVPPSAPPP